MIWDDNETIYCNICKGRINLLYADSDYADSLDTCCQITLAKFERYESARFALMRTAQELGDVTSGFRLA
jgi:hypothetical protein